MRKTHAEIKAGYLIILSNHIIRLDRLEAVTPMEGDKPQVQLALKGGCYVFVPCTDAEQLEEIVTDITTALTEI